MENNELEKLNIGNTLYTTRLSEKFKKRKAYEPAEPGAVISYIPGTVVEILVTEGTAVDAGEELVILEAMKMKNRIKSPKAGTVKNIQIKPGDRVTHGMLLMEIE